MTTLWQIAQAQDIDWDQDAFLNGFAQHPSLPGIVCEVCGNAGVQGELLPIELPNEIRGEIESIASQHGAIAFADFEEHKPRWEAALRRQGMSRDLRPGDEFQPCVWEVPSIPRFDVFWPFRTLIISVRLADIFLEENFRGVTLCPVAFGHVAEFDPLGEPVVPTGGDYDDAWFASVRCVRDTEILGRFFEVVIDCETTAVECGQVGATPNLCSRCGLGEVDETPEFKRRMGILRHRRELPIQCVPAVDVFRSHVYHEGVVVTDRVKRSLTSVSCRNYRVSEIQVIDDDSIVA